MAAKFEDWLAAIGDAVGATETGGLGHDEIKECRNRNTKYATCKLQEAEMLCFTSLRLRRVIILKKWGHYC